MTRKSRAFRCVNGHDTSKPGTLAQVRDKAGRWHSKCIQCARDSTWSRRRAASEAQRNRTEKRDADLRNDIGMPLPKGRRWQEQAACTGTDVELFFSDHREREAKRVCARCPVAKKCLAAFLFEKYGIFGGLNPDEREALRKRKQRKKV